MATQQPVYQPTVQEVYEARPDVQEDLKTRFEGQDPLTQGTEANTALNDWWNATGQTEANNMVSQGQLGPAPDKTLDVGDVSGEVGSDTLEGGADQFDIKKILSDRASDRQALLDSLTPTEAESAISTQLIDKQTEIEKEKLGLETGQTALEGQGRGITTGLVKGQQAKLEQQSLQRQRALGVEESNLLNRLGIEQKKREGLFDRAKTLLGFSNADVDISFKIQDKLDKDKKDLETRTDKLTNDAKAELEGILSMFEGIDYEDLNEQEQEQLLNLATEAGIDPNLIIRGMKIQKDNFLYDRQQAAKIEARKGASGLTPSQSITQQNKFWQEVDDGIKRLEKGAEWGQVWNRIRQQFPAETFSNEQIDKALGGSAKEQLIQGVPGPVRPTETIYTGWARPGAFKEFEVANKEIKPPTVQERTATVWAWTATENYANMSDKERINEIKSFGLNPEIFGL